jgi:hypothetical protein
LTPRRRGRCARRGPALAALLLLAAFAPVPARAQTGAGAAAAAGADSTATADSARVQSGGVVPTTATIGTPDSVFRQTVKIPFQYNSSYDLDRATGTWTQNASYGIRQGHFTADLSGTSTTTDDVLDVGLGGRGGSFMGQLNFLPAKRWVLTMDGRFQASSSGNPLSGTRQHQNRIAFRSQYSVDPLKVLSVRTILSTELQEDHNLSYRPLADTTAYSQRDSTTVTGRQDAISAQVNWKPMAGLTAMFQGGGSRVTPETRTVSTDFLRGSAGGGQRDSIAPPIETPITNNNLTGNFGFTGIRKLTAGLQLKRLENDQEYFDRVLRGQEHSSSSQRSGSLHLESTPRPPLFVSLDGVLSRSLNEYRLRKTSTSLVRTQNVAGLVSYNKPATRGSLRLEVTRARSERQLSQNGISLTRFLTATAARRVTSRFQLDGTGTASLISYQYDYPDTAIPFKDDRDQLRTFFNVGGGYAVSSQCSTTVHFSTGRTHTVAIGAEAAADNVVQTDYQMNATLLLRASRVLTIQQNYLLSAVYQIYDYTESRDFLSRIKRIDTTIADTLLPYVYANVVHNFLFRDVGPYVRPEGGGGRLYNKTAETYQQNLGVTLGLRAPSGLNAFITQNLSNTRDRSLASGSETVTNRWTLTFGGDMIRTLPGETQLQIQARHIGAYTERPPGCDGPNPPASCDRREEMYWVVNASVQKAF